MQYIGNVPRTIVLNTKLLMDDLAERSKWKDFMDQG
jgi:hypothetical protein